MHWMVDVEIALAKNFYWSLHDIDRTDIASMIPFVMRLTRESEEKPGTSGKPKTRRVYCDQVDL